MHESGGFGLFKIIDTVLLLCCCVIASSLYLVSTPESN